MKQEQSHSGRWLALWIGVLALALGFALSRPGFSAPSRVDGPIHLLRDSTATLETGELPMTENTFRARAGRIDRHAIRNAVRSGEPLELELFEDLGIRALPLGTRSLSRGGTRWHGVPERDPSGSVLLVQRRGSVTGSVQVEGRSYMIRPWRGGLHIVEEINLDLLPTGRADARPSPASRRGGGEATDARSGAEHSLSAPAADDDLRTLKVLAFFTGTARRQAGGRQAIISLIEFGIEETNIALEQSKVNARYELVAVKKMAGKESADMGDDLDALWFSDDGRFDKAHRLRDNLEADFVHLVLGDTDREFCGTAYLPNIQSEGAERDAFGVTRADCIPGRTLAHELGHNMGLAHDRPSAISQGQFKFSYGYCDPGGAFRTIMTYFSACPAPRVLHFSSPRSTYDGAPTGAKGEADNARSINRVVDYLEAFRGPSRLAADRALCSSHSGAGGGGDIVTTAPEAPAAAAAAPQDSPGSIRPAAGFAEKIDRLGDDH